MFCIVQEDITAVTKEGKLLLSNLEDPDVGECSQDQHRERPGDWETVNRWVHYITNLPDLWLETCGLFQHRCIYQKNLQTEIPEIPVDFLADFCQLWPTLIVFSSLCCGAMEQIQPHAGLSGGIQGQAGYHSGQPGLVVGNPAHSRGLKLDDHCGPFQPRPFYDSILIKWWWQQLLPATVICSDDFMKSLWDIYISSFLLGDELGSWVDCLSLGLVHLFVHLF